MIITLLYLFTLIWNQPLAYVKMTDQSFMIFLFCFYWAEAFGRWSDMDHYIYMVLFGILSELSHFCICNDGLLHPANNPILFPALKSASLKNAILGIAIYYYMRFGLFFRRLRYANSFVIQIWFLQNISHFSSLPDFSALSMPKVLFSPDAQCSWCLFFQYCLWWKWSLM